MNYEQQIAELEATKKYCEEKRDYFRAKKTRGAKTHSKLIKAAEEEINNLKKKQRTEQLARETNYKAAHVSAICKNFYTSARPTLWQRVKSWFGGV